jgi:hypothetical protein
MYVLNRSNHRPAPIPWVAKAPRLAGGKVEWDAEITRDEPNSLIAWRSLPGSDIDTAGDIRFQRAMGDRGTQVKCRCDTSLPPAISGHWISSMLGENPSASCARICATQTDHGDRELPTIIGLPQRHLHGKARATPNRTGNRCIDDRRLTQSAATMELCPFAGRDRNWS